MNKRNIYKHPTNEYGNHLLELIIAVTLLGLLSAWQLPGLKKIYLKRGVDRHAMILTHDLLSTRALAQTSKTTTKLIVDRINNTYEIYTQVNRSGLNQGNHQESLITWKVYKRATIWGNEVHIQSTNLLSDTIFFDATGTPYEGQDIPNYTPLTTQKHIVLMVADEVKNIYIAPYTGHISNE